MKVWKFCLGNDKIPVDWPWESAIRWIKTRRLVVWTEPGLCSRQFGYNYPCWTWPWGAVITFLAETHHWWWLVSGSGIVHCNCSWWQKSLALLCRNQSQGLTDISLDECTSWSLLQMCRWAVWVISPPQRASCVSSLWGALQLVSASTTWFLAEWTDSCWQARRQVVCTFLDRAQGNQRWTYKHLTGKQCFELQFFEPINSYTCMNYFRNWFDNRFIA